MNLYKALLTTLPNIKNKYVLSVVTIILICGIGFIEWITGYQLSFAFLYLLLLCFFALHKSITKPQIIFNALFACIVELVVQLNYNEPFSNYLIPYCNAIINLIVALFVSFLCYSLNVKQQALMQLNEHLNKLNIEKNKIIGITAHDLRNPFAAIQSMSEILIPAERDKENLKFLEMIHQTSKNSLKLVDNLLNISQIEMGLLQLNIQQHEYISFIKNIIDFHQIISGNKNIKIIFQCYLETLPLSFDEVHIEQVISNLILNAIKYSKPGSKIKIRVTKTSNNVLTEVVDRGVGIPENEIKMLFNFFQKTSARPTLGEKGNGLGLAISKKIVITHNGTISVKSIVGKGSNFYFFLPLEIK